MPAAPTPSAFTAAKWMTLSTQLSFLTGFVSSVFITRGLPPQEYGVYAYLLWMVGLAVSLATGALNITVIRFVAEAVGAGQVRQARALHAWLRRLLWLGLAVLGLVLGATLLQPEVYPREVGSRIHLYLGFTLVCAALKSVYMFEVSASKGHAVFQTEALSTSAIGLASMLLSGALFLTHQGLDAYLLLFLAASLAHPLLALWLMHRQDLQPRAADATPLPADLQARVRRALGWNMAFALVGLLSTRSVDTYLLGQQSLTACVGYYSIASTLSRSGLDLLTSGFSSMLLPFMSRAGAEGGRDQVQRIFAGSVRFYQFVGIGVAACASLVAEPLVTLLYGQAYRDVVPALRVMALVGGLLLPHAAYSAAFIATDHLRARLGFIGLSSAISVASAFAFVPWLGYEGALISVFVGNVSTYLIVVGIAHVALRIRFPLQHVLRQWAAACLPFWIVAVALPAGSPLWLAALACLAFGVMFLLASLHLGAWDADDLAMLGRHSPRLHKLLGLARRGGLTP